MLKFAFLTVNPAATIADLTVIATSLIDVAVRPFVAAAPVAYIALLAATALFNDAVVLIATTDTMMTDVTVTIDDVAILTVVTTALIAIDH